MLEETGLDEGIGLHTLGLLHSDLHTVHGDEAGSFLHAYMYMCLKNNQLINARGLVM